MIHQQPRQFSITGLSVHAQGQAVRISRSEPASMPHRQGNCKLPREDILEPAKRHLFTICHSPCPLRPLSQKRALICTALHALHLLLTASFPCSANLRWHCKCFHAHARLRLRWVRQLMGPWSSARYQSPSKPPAPKFVSGLAQPLPTMLRVPGVAPPRRRKMAF